VLNRGVYVRQTEAMAFEVLPREGLDWQRLGGAF